MDATALRQRWHRDLAVPEAGPVGDAGDVVFDDLVGRYREPHRRYHTLDHVAAVLDHIDELTVAVLDQGDEVVAPVLDHGDDRRALVLAAWFHDAVYDPTRADNETRSAALARHQLSGIMADDSGDLLAEVERLIELTATHAAGDHDRTGQVLSDADLSILGAAAPIYDRYREAIRHEYAHVPDDAFRRGRAALIEGFLARPHIFRGSARARRWEEPARANLRRELAEVRKYDLG